MLETRIEYAMSKRAPTFNALGAVSLISEACVSISRKEEHSSQ